MVEMSVHCSAEWRELLSADGMVETKENWRVVLMAGMLEHSTVGNLVDKLAKIQVEQMVAELVEMLVVVLAKATVVLKVDLWAER